jgi:hypothetical protein
MADVVVCPWSEGQGGDLDGEHNDILTHALTTIIGKQHDEAFGGNTMGTQWKQVKSITLISIQTLEDLNMRVGERAGGHLVVHHCEGGRSWWEVFRCH